MLARSLSALVRKTVDHTLDQTGAQPIDKGQPGAAQVHTPAPMSADDKRKQRRAALRGAVTKAAGPDAVPITAADDAGGTYVGRQLLNADQLVAWWARTRLAGEPDLDLYPHVTVAYSRAGFDWTPDPGHVVVLPSQFAGWKLLGDKCAVVLTLQSPALESRWNDTKRAGATWDHASYQPHMTLFYLGAGYDSTQWRDGHAPPVPDFPLVFGPELVGPRGVDVFATASAPDWYVPGGRVAKGDDERFHVTVNVAPAPAPTVNVMMPQPQLVRKVGALTRGADGVPRIDITEGPPDAFDAAPPAASTTPTAADTPLLTPQEG